MFLATILAFCLPLSLILWLICVIYLPNATQSPPPLRWFLAVVIPSSICWKALEKKSLAWSGVMFGLIVGFILTISNYYFGICMLIFFVTSSMATHYNQRRQPQPDANQEGGQRNWVQVICNGGVATELSFIYLLESGSGQTPINFMTDYRSSLITTGVLGSICCANGDTWASELGSVLSKGNPFLITSFGSVPKGTNGGISLIGLVVSALGGLVISIGFLVCVYMFTDRELYEASPSQSPVLILGLFAGLFGSLVDSLLGATLQYSGFDTITRKVVEFEANHVQHICGRPLLDNNSVNLLSNLITAFASTYIALYLWIS